MDDAEANFASAELENQSANAAEVAKAKQAAREAVLAQREVREEERKADI